MRPRLCALAAVCLGVLVLLSALAAVLGGCGSGGAGEPALFPAPVHGKWGYIDRAGTMVIQPAFDAALPFSDRVAVVVVNEQSGYIDDAGKIVIQPQFYRTGGFHDGLAAAGNYEDGVFREGYIDKAGAKVSQDFDEAWSFGEGLGLVRLGDKWGYVDEAGKVVIPLELYSADVFSEGLAPVRRPDYVANTGYIDKNGAYVIQPQFGSAHGFSEGLAAVTMPGGSAWGYIDKSGVVVIQPQFDMASDFSEGLAVVGTGIPDAIVDEAGAIMPAYGYKKYAYIDKSGKTVIDKPFEDAYSFSDGLARVAVDGKWGFVDKTGAFAIEPRFDSAYDFAGGLALVCADRDADIWSYIEKTGKEIWKAR
jgi:hypothetical protein